LQWRHVRVIPGSAGVSPAGPVLVGSAGPVLVGFVQSLQQKLAGEDAGAPRTEGHPLYK
jgi:hypothetical protein